MLRALALLVLAHATQAIDVSTLVVSKPALLCELDMSLMRGELRRLSWSPDGSSIHLRTIEGNALRDYIVTLPEGEISLAFGEPEWGGRYWTRKSDLTSPDDPGVKIVVREDHQRTRPAPFTGFGPNGAQTPDPRNPVDTFAIEVKLTVLGEEVGYFLNDVAFGGITFGWGPPGSAALAFVDAKGRVHLIDHDKRKLTVAGTKDAMLPAWSNDGRRIAFVQKHGRKQFHLMIANITPRT